MNADDLRGRRLPPVDGWQEALTFMGDLHPHDLLVLAGQWRVSLAALKREMRHAYRYNRSTGLWERTGVKRE